MDFNNAFTCYYHPYPASPLTEPETWENDRVVRATVVDRSPAPRSPVSAMDRYLLETERPLFKPNNVSDDGTMPPLRGLEIGQSSYQHTASYAYILPQGTPSPSNSGQSSSIVSSNWSDRQSPPWSSPGPTCSPEVAFNEHYGHGFGSHRSSVNVNSDNTNPCVTLHDVQNYADAQPERVAPDDGSEAYYALYAQEGYQPMHEKPEVLDNGLVNGVGSTHEEERRPESPNIRRRRAQSTRSITSPHLQSKVTKRPASTKRSSSYEAKGTTCSSNGCGPCGSNRGFPCPFTVYGCTSTFGSKNEWKRHVNTQHMRLGYWRCDQCEQGGQRKPNDFNRKDLFIQHVRRMHPVPGAKTAKAKSAAPRSPKNDPEEQALATIAGRCYQCVRSPPEQSSCLFCEHVFRGRSSWDERLEHIGRHMETTKKEGSEPVDPRDWLVDQALQEWLGNESLIVKKGKGWVLADGRT